MLEIPKVGMRFAGCEVIESKDVDTLGVHRWIFNRGEKSVILDMPEDQYVTFIISYSDRELMLTEMEKYVYMMLSDEGRRVLIDQGT